MSDIELPPPTELPPFPLAEIDTALAAMKAYLDEPNEQTLDWALDTADEAHRSLRLAPDLAYALTTTGTESFTYPSKANREPITEKAPRRRLVVASMIHLPVIKERGVPVLNTVLGAPAGFTGHGLILHVLEPSKHRASAHATFREQRPQPSLDIYMEPRALQSAVEAGRLLVARRASLIVRRNLFIPSEHLRMKSDP